jgi:two-component system, OmpR family, KDP operon response regulator KdpE
MLKRFRVLVADDEPHILKFVTVKLISSGYEVLTAKSGLEVLAQIQAQEPDLLILDLIMPGIDGFETLKQLRTFSSIPVIILSAREANPDKIMGLNLGADDYLAKPFNPDELVARIEAIRRRLASKENRKIIESVTLGCVTINLKNRQLVVNGKEIPLTRIEWLLLNELIQYQGKLLLYEDLLTKVWGPEYRNDVQILRTWISRLRHKIEEDPDNPIIRTVPKTGYIIDDTVK